MESKKEQRERLAVLASTRFVRPEDREAIAGMLADLKQIETLADHDNEELGGMSLIGRLENIRDIAEGKKVDR